MREPLVVTAITKCGGSGPPPGFTIIGCGAVGGHGIVSVNSLAGNQLGVEITHEFLHNQGRGHRGDAGEAPLTPGAILNPVLTLTSNIINGVECGNLHTGPTFTAADNGPIVDPPPVIICPAPATAECTTKSPSGAPQSSPPITAFLAGATATHPDAFGGLCEPTPTLANNAPVFFPKGTTPVTFTATGVDFLGASSQCQANSVLMHNLPFPIGITDARRERDYPVVCDDSADGVTRPHDSRTSRRRRAALGTVQRPVGNSPKNWASGNHWPSVHYFANTNASRSDASYWLCRPQPLLALAATYRDSANAAIPPFAHGPNNPATVPVNVPGFVAALT